MKKTDLLHFFQSLVHDNYTKWIQSERLNASPCLFCGEEFKEEEYIILVTAHKACYDQRFTKRFRALIKVILDE